MDSLKLGTQANRQEAVLLDRQLERIKDETIADIEAEFEAIREREGESIFKAANWLDPL